MATILAIESSCDETSAAIVQNGTDMRSNVVASQIKSHMRFGGVVPEIASRHHVEQITQIIDLAMTEGNATWEDVDAVAVTQGPGLVGSLLIGVTAAKTLAFAHQKPLIGVNHMAGHIYANQLISPMDYPLLALVVSGGHTELVIMRGENDFETIGDTRDDAVGEAYDKIGRVIGVPYPGGKIIDQMAHEGEDVYQYPRAMKGEDTLDFSFSGLKSAVINHMHNAKQKNETLDMNNVAASFQAAALDQLVGRTISALDQYPEINHLLVAGGVAANKGLRSQLTAAVEGLDHPVTLQFPPLSLCGDNAAMIGAAAESLYQTQQFASLALDAKPGMSLS